MLIDNILIVSSWYPSLENPTNGSFVHEQVKMLKKRGHHVTVLKPNLSGSFKETIKGKRAVNQIYYYENIQVIEIGINVYLPKCKKYYYDKLAKKAISVLTANNVKFELIHSHALLSAGIISSSIALAFNKPLVHTEHTSGLVFNPKQFDQVDKSAIRKLVEVSKKVLFVSRYARHNSLIFNEINSSKLDVLYNIVDESFFNCHFESKKNQIITIGDFSDRKNQTFLMKVWSIFNESGKNISNCQLIFAGNGFEGKNIPNGLSNVSFIPRLNREEVRKYISSSKVLLSASKLETFGLTIAESLALGTPVVVTDSGGPREIVEQGDGFIVKQNDIDEFIEKLNAVLQGNHDVPEKIRKRCHSRFSETTIYPQLLKVYLESLT